MQKENKWVTEKAIKTKKTKKTKKEWKRKEMSLNY